MVEALPTGSYQRFRLITGAIIGERPLDSHSGYLQRVGLALLPIVRSWKVIMSMFRIYTPEP